MLVLHRLTVFKMADEQRALGQLVNVNIRNGLQFFNRIDDLTVSNVGLAAREGDEETLKQLLALGKYFSFCTMRSSMWTGGPVVQKIDNAIHRLNNYPYALYYILFFFFLDSDLFGK